MKQIESKNNPIIKRAIKAINNPSGEKLIVVEGHKLLNEALKSGAKPEMIFISCEENGLPRSLTTARNDDYNSNLLDNNHNNKTNHTYHKPDELVTCKETINYE